ncbi:MAG: MFS transporter [Actinomycetota bacterium]|nr:MFS transporter [Actinomycetota bacterium]
MKEKSEKKSEEDFSSVKEADSSSTSTSAYRKVLKNRDFVALWIGQGISSLGDWVTVGVLLDAVNRIGGETGLFFMMASRLLPAFLFGFATGAIVDRLDRKSLLIFCEISRAGLVILLAFSYSTVPICILVFFIECFSLLFAPGRDSSIPDLVKKEEVMTANSLMSTTTYLTMGLGTLFATIFLGLASVIYDSFPFIHHMVERHRWQYGFAFLVDALSFIISAALIFTITFPRRRGKKAKVKVKNVWKDTKEGFKFIRSNQLTKSIFITLIVGFMGGGALYILGAPFCEQVLKATGAKFTLIIASIMFGVVAGAVLSTVVVKKMKPEKGFGGAAASFGAIVIIFALVDYYPFSLVLIFVGGIFLGYLLVNAFTLLHLNVDKEILGRIFAAFQTVMRVCLFASTGLFALLGRLFKIWIPWTKENPVAKSLNLGFMTKSIYPATLAILLGGIIVLIAGCYSAWSLGKYFASRQVSGELG